MSFFNEYALLVAVALPVVAIVGLQVFLFVAGERGTGILPGLNRNPSIEIRESGKAVTQQVVCKSATLAAAAESSNDEEARRAA